MLKKTVFSENLRFVFIFGIEGSGHHLWSKMFELCTTDLDYGVPQCHFDFHLSSLLYRNGKTPYGLFSNSSQIYEPLIKQRLKQYEKYDINANIVPLNTLGSNTGYKIGMMSYPTFAPSLYPDIVKLSKIIDGSGMDLRIIYMNRGIRDCAKSVFSRSFYLNIEDATKSLENAKRVVEYQLSQIDPQFVFPLHYDGFGRLNNPRNTAYYRLHQFLHPILLRNTLNKMISLYKPVNPKVRNDATFYPNPEMNARHHADSYRIFSVAKHFLPHFSAVHILCYRDSCPTAPAPPRVSVFDGQDTDVKYSDIINAYTSKNKYAHHPITAAVLHLHSIRFAKKRALTSVMILEIDAQITNPNDITRMTPILNGSWSLIRLSGKYLKFQTSENKCFPECQCTPVVKGICFGHAARNSNLNTDRNLDYFTRNHESYSNRCIVQDSSGYAVHSNIFYKFDRILTTLERYMKEKREVPKNIIHIDDLLWIQFDSFRLIPPIIYQEGKNYDSMTKNYMRTCTSFELPRDDHVRVYVDPHQNRLSLMIANTPFPPRMVIYGSNLQFVHEKSLPHDVNVCLHIRTNSISYGKNLSLNCNSPIPTLKIYSSEDCVTSEETHNADLIQYQSAYKLKEHQYMWFLGPRYDFDYVNHKTTVPWQERKFLFNIVSSLSTNIRRAQFVKVAKTIDACKFLFSVKSWTSDKRNGQTPLLDLNVSNYKCNYDIFGANSLDINQWRQVVINSDFTLCPPGHNPECFRIFEAAEAGSIPVFVRSDMQTSSCSKSLSYLKSMPKIVLQNLSELHRLRRYSVLEKSRMRNNLRSWYDNFMRKVVSTLEESVMFKIDRVPANRYPRPDAPDSATKQSRTSKYNERNPQC